jgi:hypothetical protein
VVIEMLWFADLGIKTSSLETFPGDELERSFRSADFYAQERFQAINTAMEL